MPAAYGTSDARYWQANTRARRFGKSLLISTLESYFSGRKDLFDGLAIADLEKDWLQYPVLHLDLTGVNYHEPEALKNTLNHALSRMMRLEKGF